MSWKVFVAALAVTLTMVGGTAAMAGTGPLATDDANAASTGEVDIDATYANGTVTVTVMQGGQPVEGAPVEMADGEYTTDANGTVVAENVDVDDELDVEVEADGFEGEVSYTVENGDLTIQSEEYEYETDDADENDEREDADEEDESAEDADEDAETENDDADEDAETENDDADEEDGDDADDEDAEEEDEDADDTDDSDQSDA